MTQTHVGPLPAPGDFAAYEQALPGAAHRILAMAEERQTAESAPIRAEAFSLRFATVATASLPWLLILATVLLGLMGQEQAALATAIGSGIAVGPQLIAAIRGRGSDHTQSQD